MIVLKFREGTWTQNTVTKLKSEQYWGSVQAMAWFGEYCSRLNLIDPDERWLAYDQVSAHVIQNNLVDIFQTFWEVKSQCLSACKN